MPSLEQLCEDWANHPLGKNRAVGGRRALSGFRYQLYLSLDRFFKLVLAGDTPEVALEGLSDLAEAKDDLLYLTQVKVTLSNSALRSAIAEALAVDSFLQECYRDFRERVRFKLTVRRVRGKTITEPALLEPDELGLAHDEAVRWQAIRERFMPVTIAGSPEIGLAVRLWQDVAQPLKLIDACVGRLIDLLGESRSSAEITKALLTLWESERLGEKPPMDLLGPADLKSTGSDDDRIVAAVRPTIDDLCDDCFMDRADYVEAALLTIRQHWAKADRAIARRRPIPVFWIVGTSGAGKSVLLMQVMRRLVLSGEIEVANWLGPYGHFLPRALACWAGERTPVALVVDDLFAPENHEPEIWRAVRTIAYRERFPNRFCVLTCGPSEQLAAFEKECRQDGTFEVVSIRVEPLSESEQEDYHAWYQARTGATLPLTKEPIFVAATWTYELYRESKLTPEQFVDRFDQRLSELGLQEQAHAALALNMFGFKAPETIFADRIPELDQLASERIYRLAHPTAGIRSGRFFHAQISRVIYEAMVPRIETRRRAEDLARGFAGMLDEGETADAFLDWLVSGKVGKIKPKGVAPLVDEIRVEVLRALWPTFKERGPSETVVPRLKRWHEMAIKSAINLRALGVSFVIRSWFQNTSEDALPWPLMFQMVWDDARDAAKNGLVDQLFTQGQAWLDDHPDSGAWSHIWPRLWHYSPGNTKLGAQALAWLVEHADYPGWSYVWRPLFHAKIDDSGILHTGLLGVAKGPESPADYPIWLDVEKLKPPTRDFLDAIVRKLVRVRSPYQMKQGVEFILQRVGQGRVAEILWPAIVETMTEPSWSYFWQSLAEKRPEEKVLGLGRDWLDGREDQPEWNYGWRKLVDQGFELDKLLPLGRDWLDGREDQPEWNYGWRKLVDQGFELDKLLPLGRDWLDGREDQPEWSHVWRKLVEYGFRATEMKEIGRCWLRTHQGQPGYANVYQVVHRR